MATANCPGCKFAPGSFKQRITIQEQTETFNDTGGATATWTSFATVWAKIESKHGSEQLLSQRIDAVDIYQITIRHLPGVLERMRVSYGSRFLQIKSVINIDELSEFMSLNCVDTGPGT